ncbi:MAG: hypothetical protein A2939_00135 [Parcubacteria group bacterium RIFCSPLOWO2_01_FULL_48_18]|nr:MAG: hypothetical protein A3J67_05910 [Parcubacteria group bacterium RIFCSPHIGHO2_02_FULL_48_10b]OHB22174.1 MAG: hypothetical protein A2939_00135 [Parcubacteria group bacterium RIFCSPLOWO2_01_FULL_48_18]
MAEKLYYAWEEFVEDSERIGKLVEVESKKRKRQFDGVYGIPRGGMILAVCLSHRLGIPMLLAPTKRSLIVDDIADTGKTLAHFRDLRCFIATLFYHPRSIVKPDVWLRKKGSAWIVFPWERE